VKRSQSARLLAVGLGLISLFASSCCKFCKQTIPASSCQKLSKDQSKAVGAFLSLGISQPDVVEVGPTRIRAYNGEDIIWTIRNPSDSDLYVGLHEVERGGLGVVSLGSVFSSTGGRTFVPKNCGIGFLQATLQAGLVANRSARGDSCHAELFHYTFMIFKPASSTGNKDSLVCTWPYDPELVVEGKP
jgi:hypothetical protein